ncbi:MAG: hypothetical protein EA381_10550 [Planctomycetaceae bacterium]|nr:MAG: hypothetical protein EA381_10550 [Planctomycetaceae bacterium]
MPLQSALPGVWQIPASIRSRVGDSAGRQRVIFEESHLLLVLHHPPQAGVMQRQGRFLWRRPDGQWTSSDGGDGPAVLAKHLDDYAKSINRYDQLEEKAATADEYFAVIEGLLPLIRSTSHLHQVMQEARKLIPDDRGLINARDQAYELERTVDLLYSAAKNGLDFEVAKKAGEEARSSRNMARSAHRLNILAAFFFPLATASSVLGMELETARETWLQAATVVAAGLLGGSLLALFVARNGRSNQSNF